MEQDEKNSLHINRRNFRRTMIMEDVLVIETKAELEKYMQKYGCTSPEQLDEVLWFEYGITLINKVK